MDVGRPTTLMGLEYQATLEIASLLDLDPEQLLIGPIEEYLRQWSDSPEDKSSE